MFNQILSVEPPISSIGSILWFSSHWSSPWISQILNLFFKVLIEIDNNGSIYFEIRTINRGFIYFDSNFSHSPFFFPNIKSIKRWHKYFWNSFVSEIFRIFLFSSFINPVSIYLVFHFYFEVSNLLSIYYRYFDSKILLFLFEVLSIEY